jgi:hypothetical protein
MASATSTQVAEIEQFEADDALHDFAGPHSGKGSDFASYWVILRVVELETAKQTDYLFVCEYMQDVAEFDSAHVPARLKLYQLKKKEGGYWSSSELTGQTGKSKVPKADKPVMKLIGHVRSFKSVQASGAFVSNSKFNVSLASGQSSVNEETIGLHLLDSSHSQGLKNAVAAAQGVKPADVDLQVLELRYTNLALDDLHRHMSGVMLEHINEVAPEHANQASSLVDTLFSRIRARARRTEKCASWPDLVTKRGFGRDSFAQAVASLKAIPDAAGRRQKLLQKLSEKFDWSFHQQTQVEISLTTCAREKVLVGEACRWSLDKAALSAVCKAAVERGEPDQKTFEAVCAQLAGELPELQAPEIKALAIYEMTEWTLSQTLA